jgi:hypothetical protein
MPKNKMILSAKVSAVQDLIAVYQELARARNTPSTSASPRPAWDRRASWPRPLR